MFTIESLIYAGNPSFSVTTWSLVDNGGEHRHYQPKTAKALKFLKITYRIVVLGGGMNLWLVSTTRFCRGSKPLPTWWMHFVMRSSVGASWSRWFGPAAEFARPAASVSLAPWLDAILGRKLVPVYINVRTALAGISLQ
jgi:hypothetical protein